MRQSLRRDCAEAWPDKQASYRVRLRYPLVYRSSGIHYTKPVFHFSPHFDTGSVFGIPTGPVFRIPGRYSGIPGRYQNTGEKWNTGLVLEYHSRRVYQWNTGPVFYQSTRSPVPRNTSMKALPVYGTSSATWELPHATTRPLGNPYLCHAVADRCICARNTSCRFPPQLRRYGLPGLRDGRISPTCSSSSRLSGRSRCTRNISKCAAWCAGRRTPRSAR